MGTSKGRKTIGAIPIKQYIGTSWKPFSKFIKWTLVLFILECPFPGLLWSIGKH